MDEMTAEPSSDGNQSRGHQWRNARSRLRSAARVILYSIAGAYLLLLCFPQPLFAHQITYRHFTVHAREPISSARSLNAAIAHEVTQLDLFPRDVDVNALAATVVKTL